MKGFCVREMRREYRGMTWLYTGSAMLFLLAMACLGAVMRARGADERLRMALIGLDAVALLTLLGLHLILTDEKNLIKKTPFGGHLRSLGAPKEIMRQIDEGAYKRFETYSSFALLDGWLMLFYTDGWRYEPRRVCARPIRKQDIRAAEALTDEPANESGRVRVCLALKDGRVYDFFLYHRRDLETLRVWLKEQEQMAL